jgi:hypothetical protein
MSVCSVMQEGSIVRTKDTASRVTVLMSRTPIAGSSIRPNDKMRCTISPAFVAPSMTRRSLPACSLFDGSFITTSSVIIRMGCKRLFNSWATPPASVPSASIFSACRSLACSSALRVSAARRSVSSSAIPSQTSLLLFLLNRAVARTERHEPSEPSTRNVRSQPLLSLCAARIVLVKFPRSSCMTKSSGESGFAESKGNLADPMTLKRMLSPESTAH